MKLTNIPAQPGKNRIDIRTKLTSGTSKTLLSYLVGFGTQGFYFLLLARALQVSDFGIWAGALALTSVFSGLVGLGAGNVLVVRVSRSRQLVSVQLGAALIYIVGSAVPLGLLAWFIGGSTGGTFAHVLFILLLSEFIAVRVFDVSLQVFQSRDDLSRNSLCRIFAGALRLVAVTLFYFYGTHTVVSWTYWYAIASGVSAVVAMLWVIGRYGYPKLQVESLRNTWRTGIFFAIGMSSRTLYLEADKFILNKFGLAADAGSLSAANRLVTMAFAPLQALVYSSNTKFFRAGEQGARSLWMTLKRPLVYTMAYGVLAGLGIALAAPLAPVLLGPSYEDVASFLIWLSPLICLNGIHYLFGDALMGLGRQGLRSMSQFSVAVLSVVANIVFIPIYGVNASVVITLSCSMSLAVLMVVIFWRQYQLAESVPSAAPSTL